MTLDKIATMNEYIIHELIQFLSPGALRSLRGTCKKIEETLSSNSVFVEKAFECVITRKLGTRKPYETQYLRRFIYDRKTEARDKYRFVKNMIRIWEQVRYEEIYYQGYVDEQSAAYTFKDIKTKIEDIREKFNQIQGFDKHFENLILGDKSVNMYNHLSDIYLVIVYAEEDSTRIANKREYLRYVSRPKSRVTERKLENRAIERIKRRLDLKYMAIFSVNVLQFLLSEIRRIQNSHMTKSAFESSRNIVD